MTCIIGLVDKGRVYLGSDSSGIGGHIVDIIKNPKVIKKGEFIIGYTDSFRIGQLLFYGDDLPEVPCHVDLFVWMIDIFIPNIRKRFTEGDIEGGGTFLVVVLSGSKMKMIWHFLY